MKETPETIVRERKAKLKELDGRLRILEARFETAANKAKEGFTEEMEDLKRMRKLLNDRLDDLKELSEATWNDLNMELIGLMEKASEKFR